MPKFFAVPPGQQATLYGVSQLFTASLLAAHSSDRSGERLLDLVDRHTPNHLFLFSVEISDQSIVIVLSVHILYQSAGVSAVW